ncbi:MAG: anion permease, partial [Candidatus Coatesbacteria bacterium]|nr:anion permease [Candidatus Coatesbacteria bacterium]
LAKVEWNTIMFFVGLFMLIGCLEYVGLFAFLGKQLVGYTSGNLLLTCLVVLWFSALISAVVDNIPLVMSMIPVVKSIIPAFAAQMGLDPGSAEVTSQIAEPLYWSLALGSCLGGNGSLVGASANIVVAQIAKRNNYRLTFFGFTRYAFPLMLFSVVISSIYIYLRYF